ncbi:F5/8 type C domain-containing protein [Humidesulfovibrio mexicanus]|uniref:F5/8 type C domain-containing protein n=1 Tax=Humidesulfovibrio mexicanus TaxID=147047 RepID=A0A238Z1M2_9BACT|nr:discoidin domain-containing protein [Humidesulfovibrio mexicanus]SNR77277.1 F5/8 type C domain-containing protein [Humidesulfovibrio mexicanus]
MFTVRKVVSVTIVFIPVILQVLWQITNNELPLADGGSIFATSYMTFLKFKEGVIQGLHFTFHSGGRPVLFSVFATPFVPLFHVSPILPTATFVVLVQIATCLIYFFAFSYKLDYLKSALLTCIITTSPFVFSIHTQFMPEIVWHMWFASFLYFILRSNDFQNLFNCTASGMALALTILARPIESVVLLAPALAVYFFYLFRNKKIVLCQFAINCFVLFVSVFGCSLVSWYGLNIYIGFLFVAFTSILFILVAKYFNINKRHSAVSRRIERKDVAMSTFPLRNFFLFLSLVLSVWMIFYAMNILFWAYDNSFGGGAQTNDQINLSRNILLILNDVTNVYGYALTVCLAFSAILAFAINYNSNQGLKNESWTCYWLFALLLSVFPMLVAYSVTGTSDSRRIFLGMIFFFFSTSYYVAYTRFNSKILSSAIWTILVLLFAIQTVAVFAVASGRASLAGTKTYLEKYYGSFGIREPRTYIGRDSDVIKAINSLGVKNAKIAVFSLGMFTDKVLYQAESLRYFALEMAPTLQFGTLWGYTKYEPYLAVVGRLHKQKFNYVLLEDLDNPIADPVTRDRLQSHTFFITDVLDMIRTQGANALPGLAIVKEFDLDGRKQYLFRVYDVLEPTITASSQCQDYSPKGLLDAEQPGWHSQRTPTYPQTVTVQFKMGISFSTVSFLPQEGNADRAPKSVALYKSDDGTCWQQIGASGDVRASTSGDWHVVNVERCSDVKHVRIVILSNCGNKDWLTLRGLRFE